MSRRIIYTLIFILQLSGCISPLNISGKYGSHENANVFQLLKDSTFIYEYRAYHFYEYSTGTWKITNRGSVNLNSHIKNTRIKINCQESKDDKLEGKNLININFKIKNGLNLSDYICEVIINDHIFLTKRCDSILTFPVDLKIKSIAFKFKKEPIKITSNRIIAPLITDAFFPKFELSGSFKFYFDIDDAWFGYTPFVNEHMKIRKNNLKLFNTYSNKWERIPKLPDSAKIFFDFQDPQQ